MSKQYSGTNNEYALKENDLIVTKTDLKGRITYANKTFLDISILEEANILNKPHSIIRHPDMPKAVYRFLWDTVKGGEEFFGVIKNLCSDGGFYWVFANITPSFDSSGNVVGYFSARRYVERELVTNMAGLYKLMLQEEVRQSDDRRAIEASTKVFNDFFIEKGVSYNEYLFSFV